MKECDLVMKGGVTSGIVYPKAIVNLAREYRFRSIGGASAGAIAAAFTAAAEYGRADGGFARFDRVQKALEAGLVPFFQPYPRYAKLFHALIRKMEQGKTPGVWFVLRNGFRLKRLIRDLPSTQFGICPGTTVDRHQGMGLVDWMNQQLEYISGRVVAPTDAPPETPLTFGMLKERNVDLRLITTNLSQARPENLPIGKGFRFRKSDLRWLLPQNVVQWIEGAMEQDGDYVRVPHGDDMPVILAVRMSLAFPILFSAIPLYSKDFSLRVDSGECAGAMDELRVNFFSDGGISSNFPIHYFDAPVPTRPTFGINLSEHHPCRHGEDDALGWNRIYMPMSAGSGVTYGINSIADLGSFFGALLSSAKDWQDSVQMRMPGYRERIVHVALKKDEGGLNLAMEQETIRRLIALGELSATRILEGEPEDGEIQRPFSLPAHRWRRLLAATEALDVALQKMVSAYQAAEPSGDPEIGSLRSFLEGLELEFDANQELFEELGYRPPAAGELKKLVTRGDELVKLRNIWDLHKLDPSWNLPSPPAAVRLRSEEF